MQTISAVLETLALILVGWLFWLLIVRLVIGIDPNAKSDNLRADALTTYADRVIPLMHEELPNMCVIDDPQERSAALLKYKKHNKQWKEAKMELDNGLNKADDRETSENLWMVVWGVVIFVGVVVFVCGGLLYAEGLIR